MLTWLLRCLFGPEAAAPEPAPVTLTAGCSAFVHRRFGAGVGVAAAASDALLQLQIGTAGLDADEPGQWLERALDAACPDDAMPANPLADIGDDEWRLAVVLRDILRALARDAQAAILTHDPTSTVPAWYPFRTTEQSEQPVLRYRITGSQGGPRYEAQFAEVLAGHWLTGPAQAIVGTAIEAGVWQTDDVADIASDNGDPKHVVERVPPPTGDATLRRAALLDALRQVCREIAGHPEFNRRGGPAVLHDGWLLVTTRALAPMIEDQTRTLGIRRREVYRLLRDNGLIAGPANKPIHRIVLMEGSQQQRTAVAAVGAETIWPEPRERPAEFTGKVADFALPPNTAAARSDDDRPVRSTLFTEQRSE